MKKIVVYFCNNNKAQFDDGCVYIETSQRPDADDIIRDAMEGCSVVNWNNVCFIRAVEEREAEE